MRIFCLFFSLFCLSVFADQTVSFSFSVNQRPGDDSWLRTPYSCPLNAISIANTSPQYAGDIGLVRLSDNQMIDVGNRAIDPSLYAPTFYVRQSGYWESGTTISWTVNCNGAPQYPDDPGPDNPDPEDPDPDNPDPDNPGGNDEPWALESSLQTYMSNFQTFSQAFSNWASALLGDVRAGNATASSVLSVLTGINSQQINDHEHRGLLHDDMKSFLGPLRDNVSGIKTGIDGLNTKSSQSLTAQNLGNSYLSSIEDNSGQIKDKAASIDNKFSTANSNLSDIKSSVSSIKDSLNPQGISSPSVPSPMSNLPSGSGFIQTVKSRLLPGYSFFVPTGDSWPSWTFTFPLSSFGMDDLTVTLGGSDWQTVAGGRIVWLASIIRTLSKFAFYLIFFNAVIRALRQW